MEFFGACFAVATLVASVPCAPHVEEQTVSVHVRPWADVLVDGDVAAEGVMDVELALAPGVHTLSFRNPAAMEVDRVITISACEPSQVIVELVRRPAMLSVRSIPGDAEVAVCGPAVPTRPTRHEPLLVMTPSAVADVDLLVSRPGFPTVIKRVRLDAGQTTEVLVVLERD